MRGGGGGGGGGVVVLLSRRERRVRVTNSVPVPSPLLCAVVQVKGEVDFFLFFFVCGLGAKASWRMRKEGRTRGWREGIVES